MAAWTSGSAMASPAISATFSLSNSVVPAHTAIAVTVSTTMASTPSTPATTPLARLPALLLAGAAGSDGPASGRS